MSNPTEIDDQNNVVAQAATQVADFMGGMFDPQPGSSVVEPDVGMGKLFLALTKNPNVPSYDRAEGAQLAYNSWYENTERRLMRGLRDGDAIPTADDIRQAMADELEAQLVTLNNDRALSADASEKIKQLMTGGPNAFSEAIEENGGHVDDAYASYVAAKKAYEETKKSDPNAKIAEPALDVVGILAVLQQPNSEDQTPTLNAVKTAHLDVSAEGQRDASLRGAMESVVDFMNGGGGSEAYLKRLHRISSSEGLNRIAGFGGLGPPDFEREFGAFLSAEGLSDVRGEAFKDHHDRFSLTDMGEKRPANFENLITRAGFEDTGLATFDSDQARQDFTQHMAAYIAEKKMNREPLDPEELQKHMEELALARSDITLSTENDVQASHQLDAVEARRAARELAETQPTAVRQDIARPILEERERLQAQATANDPRSAHGITVFSADPQLAQVFDPTVPAGAANLPNMPSVTATLNQNPPTNAPTPLGPAPTADPTFTPQT